MGKTKSMTLLDKYKLSITELEGLYRSFVFKQLPVYDEKKIELILNLTATGISEATYILNFLDKTRNLDGDICEFGVAQGATSALIAYEIRNSVKKLWLYDSFAGLPKPTCHDTLKDDIFELGTIEEYEGTMTYSINEVIERLSQISFPLDRVNIIPGFIEDTIKKSKMPEKVSFAYVDFDFYKPISIALKFLDKLLEPGGVVIVDDYDFFSTGVKKAVDEFIVKNKTMYRFSLPIKPAGFFCILEKCVKN